MEWEDTENVLSKYLPERYNTFKLIDLMNIKEFILKDKESRLQEFLDKFIECLVPDNLYSKAFIEYCTGLHRFFLLDNLELFIQSYNKLGWEKIFSFLNSDSPYVGDILPPIFDFFPPKQSEFPLIFKYLPLVCNYQASLSWSKFFKLVLAHGFFLNDDVPRIELFNYLTDIETMSNLISLLGPGLRINYYVAYVVLSYIYTMLNRCSDDNLYTLWLYKEFRFLDNTKYIDFIDQLVLKLMTFMDSKVFTKVISYLLCPMKFQSECLFVYVDCLLLLNKILLRYFDNLGYYHFDHQISLINTSYTLFCNLINVKFYINDSAVISSLHSLLKVEDSMKLSYHINNASLYFIQTISSLIFGKMNLEMSHDQAINTNQTKIIKSIFMIPHFYSELFKDIMTDDILTNNTIINSYISKIIQSFRFHYFSVFSSSNTIKLTTKEVNIYKKIIEHKLFVEFEKYILLILQKFKFVQDNICAILSKKYYQSLLSDLNSIPPFVFRIK